MELRAACRVQDPGIEDSWARLGFVLETSAIAQADYMTKSQSSLKNAKFAAESATFNVFAAELANDQSFHRAQVAMLHAESAKRKAVLVQTLEDYHNRSWRLVQDVTDTLAPTRSSPAT